REGVFSRRERRHPEKAWIALQSRAGARLFLRAGHEAAGRLRHGIDRGRTVDKASLLERPALRPRAKRDAGGRGERASIEGPPPEARRATRVILLQDGYVGQARREPQDL